MKVITLGMGQNIYYENSAVRLRMIEYGKLFDELHVVVFTPHKEKFVNQKLSSNVFLYPTRTKIRVLYFLDFFRIIKNIIKNSNKKDFVLSAQDPFETGLVGLLLKLLYKLPLQIQLHTDFANKYFITHNFLNFLRFPIGIFVLSFADSVRVVSKRIEKSIHSLTHNVSILPIYTNLHSFSDLRDSVNLDNSKSLSLKLLTVCRLEKEKDLETAIRAFKIVLDAGVDAVFTIVGDGDERSSLELLVKNLGIDDKVKFVGWQDNLARFYESADVYLSTSLYEGYGMSTVEAASYGLPLVLSETGVVGEIFEDKKEALVCRQKDVTGFGQAMLALTSDFNLRKEIGEKAREAVLKNQITQDQYLVAYKDSMQQALVFFEANHNLFKTNILLRYFVAGITAASSQIFLLYVFTDLFKIWYLYSSILSFVIGITLSFVLQKFWTFRDQVIDKIHHQALMYLGVALLGLGFNTILMYGLVDIFNVWYILAQIIVGGFIMVFNFLMYKFFIFNKRT